MCFVNISRSNAQDIGFNIVEMASKEDSLDLTIFIHVNPYRKASFLINELN